MRQGPGAAKLQIDGWAVELQIAGHRMCHLSPPRHTLDTTFLFNWVLAHHILQCRWQQTQKYSVLVKTEPSDAFICVKLLVHTTKASIPHHNTHFMQGDPYDRSSTFYMFYIQIRRI